MELIAGSYSLETENPSYGYEVTYHTSLIVNELRSAFKIYDRGSTYDYRTLSISKKDIPESLMSTLEDYLNSPDVFRCENITLRLGSTPTGFFPAGPDKGDVGDFTVRVMQNQSSGIKTNPWRYFNESFEFVIVSTPSYSIPALVQEGNISLCSLTNGFRYPEDGFNPSYKYGRVQLLTNSGDPYSVDGGESSDLLTTEFTLNTRAPNMGRLLDSLLTLRGGETELVTLSKHYPFGTTPSETLDSPSTYDVQCVNSEFSVIHSRYDNFSVNLKLWRV